MGKGKITFGWAIIGLNWLVIAILSMWIGIIIAI